MLDLKLGEWCKIPLYDKIQKKTKEEMLKLLENCGFIRATYYSYNKATYGPVPALLGYRPPISIGTKYIYIARDFQVYPSVITDKKHPNYGQVTIAQESDGWKHNEWDISCYSDEKREFKVVDEDFLCGYAKRLNRFKKELDISLLSLNAEVENEN